MDSPIFGASNSYKKQMRNHDRPSQMQQSLTMNHHTKLIFAMLQLQKNVRKLHACLNKCISRKNRDAFWEFQRYSKQIKQSQSIIEKSSIIIQKPKSNCLNQQNPEVQHRQLTCLMNIKDKLDVVYMTAKQQRMKGLLQAWSRLSTYRTGSHMLLEPENSKLGISSKIENKKVSSKTRGKQMKQNSTSNINVNDLSVQNERLRNQLESQQQDLDTFLSKMNNLLQVHQKNLTQHSKAKKK